MKAWRMHAFGDVRFEEVPMPELKPGWVLAKVRVVQPSVTEIGMMEDPQFYIWGGQQAFAEGGVVQPGHEFCGDVVEIKGDLKTLRVGDKVSTVGALPCGECEACLAGRVHECKDVGFIGRNIPGAFAEYIAVPERACIKMPDGISYSEGAAVQPLSSAFTSVESAQLRMGDTVVVMGQGVMGLGCMQISRVSGAGLIIGVDVRQEALDMSKRLGADAVVDASKDDPVEAIRDLTHGFGADVVFDAASGRPEEGLSGSATFHQAVDIVAMPGKIVQTAGHPPGRLEIDPQMFRHKHMRYIYPPFGSALAMRRAAFLVAAKRIQIAPTITHTLHGLEKMSEAWEITANKAKYKAINPAQVVVS